MYKHSIQSAEWAFLVPVLLLCLVSSSTASVCYHGLETVNSNSDLIVDPGYWLRTTGQDTAAEPVNCTKRVGDGYDTCSIFCRTYQMLSSEETVTRCRRFCMRWEECNATRVSEFEFCQAERDLPRGNLVLLGCTQKCSFEINSNFLPTCDGKGGGGCCGPPVGGAEEQCATGSAERLGARGYGFGMLTLMCIFLWAWQILV